MGASLGFKHYSNHTRSLLLAGCMLYIPKLKLNKKKLCLVEDTDLFNNILPQGL